MKEKPPSFEKFNENFDMYLEGNPEVFKNLFTKAEMLKVGNPEHSKIRPLLIVPPGTMRTIVGGRK